MSVLKFFSGPQNIQLGVWHSHGSTVVMAGTMLTMPTFWFAVTAFTLSALATWSLSRLWQIACAVIFRIVYRERCTWEESQNFALIVNTKSALDGFLAAGQLLIKRRMTPRGTKSRRARFTLIAIVITGFSILALTWAFPFLFAFIPRSTSGLLKPNNCGTIPADIVPNGFQWLAKLTRVADSAFVMLDANNSDPVTTLSKPSPDIHSFYVDHCPQNVTVCSSEFPFTFTSNYTLSSRHFALNTHTPFSLSVFEKCYRPLDATGTLRQPGSYDQVVLYYRPLNSTGVVVEYTESTVEERRLSPGYTLTQQSANANHSGVWLPNSTLLQGGDTSIFFYYVGGVTMTNKSSDPIFATDNAPVDNDVLKGIYNPLTVVVPIVCDTKYVVCEDKTGDCSEPIGRVGLMELLSKKGGDFWPQLGALFVTLFYPPIYQASVDAAAIAASQSTTNGGAFQGDPLHVTAQRELTRLATAGMAIMASQPRLAATGFWDLGEGAKGLGLRDDPRSLCRNVVVESSGVMTIPVITYSILLVFLLLPILISYSYILIGKIHPTWEHFHGVWTLYSAGQLHREVTESIRGRIRGVDTSAAWPTVATCHMGVNVGMTGNKTRRFTCFDREPPWDAGKMHA